MLMVMMVVVACMSPVLSQTLAAAYTHIHTRTLMSCTACSPFSFERQRMCTVAPICARLCAALRPMPALPPATSTDFV